MARIMQIPLRFPLQNAKLLSTVLKPSVLINDLTCPSEQFSNDLTFRQKDRW